MSQSANAQTARHACFCIGLTGGIASGKSVVLQHFERLGVAVFDADLITRALVVPGQPALTEIVAAFGTAMLTADGTLARERLRERIFTDSNARLRLEAILHPRVRAELMRRAKACTTGYCILAVPLLAEHHSDYRWLDRILVVDAKPGTQIDRLMQRDKMTKLAAQRILDAQATRAQRLAIAADLIDNEGPLMQLDSVMPRLDRYYRLRVAQAARD